MIYWFTGQPGSGKTSLAKELSRYIPNCELIDGDELRELTSNKLYDKSSRLKNVELAQNIALFLSSKKRNVIVSVVSPYRKQRELFKNKANVIEIYLETTRLAKSKFVVKDYEKPLINFITLETSNLINKSLEELLVKLNIVK